MLIEIKTDVLHYFEDDNGVTQGLYKGFHYDGNLRILTQVVDNWFVGELIEFDECGVIIRHEYRVGTDLVHDFLKHPLTDIEKMLLVLKHGAPLLPRGMK